MIVPAFTWISTANAVLYGGMEPVFCDIDLDTYNMDMKLAAGMIDEDVRAIMPVHQFGYPAEVNRFFVHRSGLRMTNVSKDEKIVMIEDAACGMNGRINGKHVGNFGLMGCFSFHPRKAITSGDGGMVVTNNREVYELLKSLRNHGQAAGKNAGKPYGLSEFEYLGFNYRMTEMQAAILIPQLERETINYAKRRNIAEIYCEELKNVEFLILNDEFKEQKNTEIEIEHGWQSFVCLFGGAEVTMKNVKKWNKRRNEFMEYMDEKGIMTRPGTYSLHTTKFYREKYGFKKEDFPNAYLAQECTVALPIFPGMKEEELEFVINCINSK